ncbi:hypothetical protein [Brachybacterium sp. FME24]|uniref:hypothetical protein n=1 Tax=Brachybacterium sp. FME24 TaxID=2742605 RepID=UPI001D046EFE|nr:hypothetical protein [Brachybacterium sp. FME24]
MGNPLGAPVPSYVILEGAAGEVADGRFGVQFMRVPDDIEAEIESTFASGMPEAEAHAIELRTGIYRGAHEVLGLR